MFLELELKLTFSYLPDVECIQILDVVHEVFLSIQHQMEWHLVHVDVVVQLADLHIVGVVVVQHLHSLNIVDVVLVFELVAVNESWIHVEP